MNIGAYLQCYKNPYATYKCLESFRKFYPTSTVVLLSDNGYDYSKMAEYFNCIYIHSVENLVLIYDNLGTEGALANSTKLVKRFCGALLLCEEDYVMWLEDDVSINNKITDNFQYDINGFCPNTIVTDVLCKNYPILESGKKYHFTGHGGSVFHKKNTLNALVKEEVLTDVVNNWQKYELPTTLCQDYLFSILVTLNGGTIGPYNSHSECQHDIIQTGIDIQHQYKRWYGFPMPEHLKYLVKTI
jgi:hypothetical protein